MSHCPICQHQSIRAEHDREGRDAFYFECPKCGKFRMTMSAVATDFTKYGPRHVLSALIRNRSEHRETIELTTDSFKHIFDSAPKLDDPFLRIDLLLDHTLKRGGRLDRSVTFNGDVDYPLVFGEDKDEFWFYVNKAIQAGLLENTNKGYRLTPDGWKRLEHLRRTASRSDQAFVAMWFDEALDEAWENGFKAGLEACGFKALRIDLQEHNEKICDRIISEIRRSGLVIADFTGQRGGVYFESGFAMGLGIPVIRTCRQDYIGSLHFDTRQYNHVVWTSPEDLRLNLINRIRATISVPGQIGRAHV